MLQYRFSLVPLVIVCCLVLGGGSNDCNPEPEEIVCQGNQDCAAGEYCASNKCVACADLHCGIVCEHGYQVDQNGCDLCRCKQPRDYCNSATDCACGVDIDSGQCAVANAQYVDTQEQCPDFCTGIAGNLVTVCEDHRCGLEARECWSDDDCVRTGCSGQLCSYHDVTTTCEWLEVYACYNEDYTSCGCQDGFCAFEQTSDFLECLDFYN